MTKKELEMVCLFYEDYSDSSELTGPPFTKLHSDSLVSIMAR